MIQLLNSIKLFIFLINFQKKLQSSKNKTSCCSKHFWKSEFRIKKYNLKRKMELCFKNQSQKIGHLIRDKSKMK
jgi:hypothetical protein